MAIGVWFVPIAIGIINGKNEQVKYLGQDWYKKKILVILFQF